MTGAERSTRNLALAFGTGAVAALLLDAALRNAVAAVQSPGVSSMTPWWVIGQVLERSVWVAAAMLAWLLAPGSSRWAQAVLPADRVIGRSAALDVVGRMMIAAPLLWLVATWVVVALKMTLVGSWGTEGRALASASYYSNVLLGYAPWAGAGITLLALGRHTDAE